MTSRLLRTLVPVLAAALCGCSEDFLMPSPSPSASGTPASLNMTLMSNLPLANLAVGGAAPVSAAGNWGYTAPNGRRFALTGVSNGLSIVEVTNPAQPRAVALVEGPSSTWREVRTYRTYAYVTTEARYGLDIIDLSDPDRPRKVQTLSRTFTSAHSLWIDEDRGLLFAHGTSFGMRVLDVGRNPEDPPEVGSFSTFYIHDSYSRGDVLYAAAINNGFLALLDVSDASRIREITRFNTGGRFTHNAWLSRDGRYVFTTDERLGLPLETWDLRDPFSPRKVSEYIAATNSVAHNVMVDGDRLLVAHYTEGVHLLDVRDPERPTVLGFYDTFTRSSCSSFPFCGVWGAYIFPGSDLILASDIQGGLFVIRTSR